MELHMIFLTFFFFLGLAVATDPNNNNTTVEAAMTTTTRHDLAVTGGGGSSLCVRMASPEAYDGVVALKDEDGSGPLLFWSRKGKIWAPEVRDKPLIDLGGRLSQSQDADARGLAGVAVHHSTGRVFLSYYSASPNGSSAASLVVDELSSPSGWKNEAEATLTTRRVFSIAAAEPRSSSAFPVDFYAGQIMSRPTSSDPFIYIITGPAQSDGQLQAQIVRFSVGEHNASGHVYAAGLGIPRRCAFDTERSQDLYCAIVKDDQELVYLISDPGAPSTSATPPSPTLIVAQQRPIPPSIIGGLLYRGYADNALHGSYIYMDRSKLWMTVTSPDRNVSVARDIRVTCSASTASPSCSGGDFTGTVTSFGEDADKNALLLATNGAYLVVEPTLCDTNPKDPTSKTNLLKWVLGAIGGLAGALLTGYVGYKIIVNCCNNNGNNHQANAQNVIGNNNNVIVKY
ncbi:HIPL2 protein [Sorghum bicolor]|uniref:Uncharacterized protein n=1 Tax=Sorghum bicolor TaxID=4558 RepID=A0A194YM90_SORBI|nr:HIPL2 protein [Sorghum bicolor]KXG29343.1 hypothetical protein SORBI_3004G022900 [Sorghum bicolor]|eukprot:XP_002451440.2 HIPL2 protein [Sorghum bicolor]